jgi:hypothetical protein
MPQAELAHSKLLPHWTRFLLNPSEPSRLPLNSTLVTAAQHLSSRLSAAVSEGQRSCHVDRPERPSPVIEICALLQFSAELCLPPTPSVIRDRTVCWRFIWKGGTTASETESGRSKPLIEFVIRRWRDIRCSRYEGNSRGSAVFGFCDDIEARDFRRRCEWCGWWKK